MTNLKDEATNGRIIAALSASPGVNAAEIRVHSYEGHVRLEGVVKTLNEKDVAEKIAAAISGVKSVENRIVLGTDRDITDLEIEDSIRTILDNGGFAGVGVKVKAGNAFLLGVVSNLADKKRAMDLASTARGVRDVLSELEIAVGVPVDDVSMANDVVEALSDDPRISLLDLEVHADDSAVCISGSAPDENQIRIAADIAESVPGVQKVDNQLKVFKSAYL